MGGYSVQVAELGDLMNGFGRASERIADAHDALRAAMADDLGTPGLDEAGSAFQLRWEHGTRGIGLFSGQVVEALGGTYRAYQAAESAVEQALTPGTAPPAGAIGRALEGDR